LSLGYLDNFFNLFFAFLLLLFCNDLNYSVDVIMVLIMELFVDKGIEAICGRIADLLDIRFGHVQANNS
jgi:hypothetical protein